MLMVNQLVGFGAFGAALPETSYSNTLSTGNRTGLIAVTATLTVEAGTLAGLVNGSLGNDHVWNVGQTSGYLKFDFLATGYLVTEMLWEQDASTQDHGQFQAAVSDDDSSYTDVGSPQNIGVTGTSLFTQLNANMTTCRYLRFTKTGTGSTKNSAFNREVQFKISA